MAGLHSILFLYLPGTDHWLLNVSTERVLTHQPVPLSHFADRETKARRPVNGSRSHGGLTGESAFEAMLFGGP